MDTNEAFKKTLQKLDALYESWWPYVIALIIAVITTIRSYMAGSTCPSNTQINGKNVIITGASSGIGRETALELAKRGGRIILAVRNIEAGEKVAEQIRKFNGTAEVRKLDLSSLDSVRKFAESLDLNRVDVLINNAGIAFYPFEKTKEGFEMHFASNYLGHFFLTHLLLPKIKASQQGRIINVSAQAHISGEINFDDLNCEKDYSSRKSFSQSKLALILMATHMSELLKGTKVTINTVDPGLVKDTQHLQKSPLNSTFIFKFLMKLFMSLLFKSPSQGAQTSVFAVVSSSLNDKTGKYLKDCAIASASTKALDHELAEKLYNKSLQLLEPHSELDGSVEKD